MDERVEGMLARLLTALTTALAEHAESETLDRIAGVAGKLRLADSDLRMEAALTDADAVMTAWRQRATGLALPPPDERSGNHDRRSHRRFDVYAMVRLEGPLAVLVSVRNLSVTGALLKNDGHDLSTLTVGRTVGIAVFHPDRPSAAIRLTARVVRQEPTGVALSWDEHQDAAGSLLRLIGGW
jgi:hypothetical protein